jgi:hypothetical protein
MAHQHPQHLTPADVEAWLEGKLSLAASTHVGQCDACRTQLRAEGALIEELQRLPRYAPSVDFEERVMARVRLPAARPVAAPAAAPARRSRRWLAAAGVVGVLGASLTWSIANQTVLTDASQWALGEGWAAASSAADQLRSLLAAQPAYREIRDAVGTPARLAAVSSALAVLYGTGVLALRRLLALPSTGVAHANR